ncbi:uncharacterized protein K452DRAFT_308531 [Aplosporella prunicola CBS 121167]|uniref:Uncharacterized protein n=1 Tax=Aplosporella prunicola CBS 121167 TaxID=1176127 RepID=A0A6A6BFR4_9PEZI|nr:uncharacterized protein K452DRAFT_308531 [Aplosporella prunicola CBS 121167]KAF2142145.1 hypothetical protein K452DRAFT_308531 [Aplosporella prunicola CBS 121167]
MPSFKWRYVPNYRKLRNKLSNSGNRIIRNFNDAELGLRARLAMTRWICCLCGYQQAFLHEARAWHHQWVECRACTHTACQECDVSCDDDSDEMQKIFHDKAQACANLNNGGQETFCYICRCGDPIIVAGESRRRVTLRRGAKTMDLAQASLVDFARGRCAQCRRRYDSTCLKLVARARASAAGGDADEARAAGCSSSGRSDDDSAAAAASSSSSEKEGQEAINSRQSAAFPSLSTSSSSVGPGVRQSQTCPSGQTCVSGRPRQPVERHSPTPFSAIRTSSSPESAPTPESHQKCQQPTDPYSPRPGAEETFLQPSPSVALSPLLDDNLRALLGPLLNSPEDEHRLSQLLQSSPENTTHHPHDLPNPPGSASDELHDERRVQLTIDPLPTCKNPSLGALEHHQQHQRHLDLDYYSPYYDFHHHRQHHFIQNGYESRPYAAISRPQQEHLSGNPASSPDAISSSQRADLSLEQVSSSQQRRTSVASTCTTPAVDAPFTSDDVDKLLEQTYFAAPSPKANKQHQRRNSVKVDMGRRKIEWQPGWSFQDYLAEMRRPVKGNLWRQYGKRC